MGYMVSKAVESEKPTLVVVMVATSSTMVLNVRYAYTYQNVVLEPFIHVYKITCVLLVINVPC